MIIPDVPGCPVMGWSQRYERIVMMNHTFGWMNGWMGGQMSIWAVLAVLVVVVVVVRSMTRKRR